MKENEYSSITVKVRSFFLAALFSQPLLFFLFSIPTLDSGITGLLKVFAIAYPLPLCIMFILFYQQYKTFCMDIAFVYDEKNSGNIPRERMLSINYFPLKTCIILWAGFAASILISVILFIYYNIYDTIYVAGFVGMLGLITILLASGIYYTKIKKTMFPLVDYVYYRALTIFEKIAGPVILSVLVLLSVVSVLKFSFVDNILRDIRQREIAESVEKTSLAIDSFISELYSELHIYSISQVAKDMNYAGLTSYLIELEKNKRNMNFQLYFACDTTGKGPTSKGKSGDISKLPEFQQCITSGQPSFTNPMKSQITDDYIIIGLYPVKKDGKVVGVIGGTVLMDGITKILTKEQKYTTGRFLVFNKDGKIIFSATQAIIGKVLGVDIKDDGKKTIGANRLITSEEHSFLEYTFMGKDTVSYKSRIPMLGDYILFSIDKNEFYKVSTRLIIMELVFFVIFASVSFGVVWIIARGFSTPIRNTIKIFKKLSEGDLSVKSDDYLADEFGLLVRNLKRFISKIRTVINVSSDASVNLAQSVEELSATSQSISELSQTQAASIEETSASVEEVAASIEMIAAHAKEQFELSKSTFKSMSELQAVGGEVLESAGEALQLSEQTTCKASEGSELMNRTIAGMNQIDNSTRSIAEMVAIISDISDRVAMLALNASIEAARAGDQGRGFAVVAEEVSKLAEETAVTAKKITEVVSAGRHEVSSGIEYVNKTSDAFKAITDNIQKTQGSIKNISDSLIKQAEKSNTVLSETGRVMEMAEKISASTGEQLVINQEISKTIDQINRNTQTSASGAEEVASSAEEISAQAESLMEQMKFFKV